MKYDRSILNSTFGRTTFLFVFQLIIGFWMFIQAQSEETQEDYFKSNFLRYENYIYKPNVKTILIHKKGWLLSYPVIHLNGTDVLEFSFDDLDTDIKDYYYTVVQCNSDWTPSQLMQSDYIEGFIGQPISDFKHSFNTFCSFIHYKVVLPNEDLKIKLSGNYILKVYENYDENDLVITRRFSVIDELVDIKATIKRATDLDEQKTSQEIDFSVIYAGLVVSDPYNEIKVVLTQNNRWDNCLSGLKPIYVRDNELIYDDDRGNVFKAGSESRYFNLRSLRYQSDRIATIEYIEPYHHVKLLPDEPRTFRVYFHDKDLNGKYYPEIQEAEDDEIEPDYAWVYFSLPYDAPIVDGNLYIFGGLSDWSFREENRMVYNFEKKEYQLRMLLKQGYYNYDYVFLKDGATAGDITFMEGSHYETENDYIIYIYHRGVTDQYDKLVGIEIINSQRRE